MFRTNRRQPGFDSLESVLVLSPGVFATASSVLSENAQGQPLELNGTLHGNKTVLNLDSGARARRGFASYRWFDLVFRHQRATECAGKVSGSFGPNRATDFSTGELPNLSNLTLDLSNHTGSVQITLAPSATNLYQFRVTGGTGAYADAHGLGWLRVNFHEGSNEYLLVLRSVAG